MSSAWSRAIVITPRFEGPDGVSAVTRAYAHALASRVGEGLARVDVWSLGDEVSQARSADARMGLRCAGGRQSVFATYGLFERGIDSSTLVIVQHVHLLPVVLPLLARGARVMLVLHGVEAWKRLRPLERAALRRTWKIAAVSAHTIRRFREANPDLADLPVEVCAPGVAPRAAGDGAVVQGPYALIVGRMDAAERYKGHDELLDVWPRIRAMVPGATLVVAGGGDDAGRLEQKAAQLGISDAVRFEGVVSDARLSSLYEGASVFVMPSPNEGFGLVFAEAMRAGTPCIVASGAAEEIVEHGKTGLVVSAGDRRALEDALLRLLTSRDDRERMGARAAAASTRFTLDAFAGRLYGLIELSIGRTPARREFTATC